MYNNRSAVLLAKRSGDAMRRAAAVRRANGWRCGINPATSEKDYSTDDIEFMMAMDNYKRTSGRTFPTWSEVLGVLMSLGYTKARVVRPVPMIESGVRRAKHSERERDPVRE